MRFSTLWRTMIIVWIVAISFISTQSYITVYKLVTRRTASPEQVQQINDNTLRILVLETRVDGIDQHGTKRLQDMHD